MGHPSVVERSTRRFEIVSSGAFVTYFTQTLGAGESASFAISQPHTPFLPGHTLGLRGGDPLNLLHVPSGDGQVSGGYRITVSMARFGDRVDLTCTITRTDAGPGTDRWELRGTRDDLVTWDVGFADGSAGTVVECVVCDPRAELAPVDDGAGDGSVVLRAADPRGAPDAPTVVGTLPPDLEPRISWIVVDGAEVEGLPRCTTAAELAVTLPPAGRAAVSFAVRTTFGGTCPLNTAYLETTSEPVELAGTARS